MGFTYFIWDMLGGSGVGITAAPHICQPAGILMSYDFTRLDLTNGFTRFDLSHNGVTEWAEDC